VNGDTILPELSGGVIDQGERLARFERREDEPVVRKINGLDRAIERRAMRWPGIAGGLAGVVGCACALAATKPAATNTPRPVLPIPGVRFVISVFVMS